MVLRACQPLIKIAQSYRRKPSLKLNINSSLEKLPEPVISQKSPDYTPKISAGNSIFDFSIFSPEKNSEPKIRQYSHFLEEMMVIGVDNQDLRDPINNYMDIMSEIRVQPKLLYRQGNRFSDAQSYDNICSFLFPFGFTVKKIPEFSVDSITDQ